MNLGFESADLPPIPQGQFGGFVPISQALPGWKGVLGTNTVTSVLQNNAAVGGANISIFGPNWTTAQIIEGQYTVLLQPGAFGALDVDASLVQTGVIPIGSQSLRFKAAGWSDVWIPEFSVYFTGQQLSAIPLSSGPNYTYYGADVSAFSGQKGDLEFMALANSSHPNNILLDSFVFSPIPVPEPEPLALLGLAIVIPLVWQRFRRPFVKLGSK